MKIEIDTQNLTAVDLKILAALTDQSVSGEFEQRAADAVEPPAPAPTKKAQAKPVVAEPVVVPEPRPEPEVPTSEEATSGGDTPTKSDAVALATQMVSNGKAAAVRSALNDLGIKRVSELAEEQVAAFIAALGE